MAKLSSRLITKHATPDKWNQSELIPFKGEQIIYDRDETYGRARIKIGDGEHLAKDLPFIDDIKVSITTEHEATTVITSIELPSMTPSSYTKPSMSQVLSDDDTLTIVFDSGSYEASEFIPGTVETETISYVTNVSSSVNV